MCAFVYLYVYTHTCMSLEYIQYIQYIKKDTDIMQGDLKNILKCVGLVRAVKVINSKHAFRSYIGRFLKAAAMLLINGK